MASGALVGTWVNHAPPDSILTGCRWDVEGVRIQRTSSQTDLATCSLNRFYFGGTSLYFFDVSKCSLCHGKLETCTGYSVTTFDIYWSLKSCYTVTGASSNFSMTKRALARAAKAVRTWSKVETV